MLFLPIRFVCELNLTLKECYFKKENGISELHNEDKKEISTARTKKKTPWLWSASELCRPNDRRFLAK
jgi:hypothetical protein